jgi:hypothetical protein
VKGALQGEGVALSADGKTAIVGGLGDNAIGAVWVFSAPPFTPPGSTDSGSSQATIASQLSQTKEDAPATDCDNYAADPSDPKRKAKGILLESLDPALAIPACESAVRQYPTSNRLVFQLGRAYQKKLTSIPH